MPHPAAEGQVEPMTELDDLIADQRADAERGPYQPPQVVRDQTGAAVAIFLPWETEPGWNGPELRTVLASPAYGSPAYLARPAVRNGERERVRQVRGWTRVSELDSLKLKLRRAGGGKQRVLIKARIARIERALAGGFPREATWTGPGAPCDEPLPPNDYRPPMPRQADYLVHTVRGWTGGASYLQEA